MSVIAFEVESFDPVSKLLQTMYLKFFLDNNTIELLQGSKFFLARIFYPDVTLADLFIGNSVNIYNRRYLIKSYANAGTTEFMASREVHYLCVLKSAASGLFGPVVTLGTEYELKLGKVKTSGAAFRVEGHSFSPGDIAFELVSVAAADTRAFVSRATDLSPSKGLVVIPASSSALADVFSGLSPVRVPSDCTLCLVKPHVLQANGYTGSYSFKLDGKIVWDNKEKERNRTGALITSITDAGFQIRGALSVHLSPSMAENFFDVYRGVFAIYAPIVEHMASGPTLALLLTSSRAAGHPDFDEFDTVKSFRAICGPAEPEVAKVLRPDTLRAVFGVDLIRNAVHCTDLSEDGELECKHFFETIAAVV